MKILMCKDCIRRCPTRDDLSDTIRATRDTQYNKFCGEFIDQKEHDFFTGGNKMKKSLTTILSVGCVLVFAVLVFTLITSCALLPAVVPQDKPFDSTQCFEGKFNVHRVTNEDWEVVGKTGNVYFLGNPIHHQYPQVVAMLIHPSGLIVAYAYLDGKNLVSYKFNTTNRCYEAEELPLEIENMLKLHIQNITKERLVTA